jgi:hypothetical protein
MSISNSITALTQSREPLCAIILTEVVRTNELLPQS